MGRSLHLFRKAWQRRRRQRAEDDRFRLAIEGANDGIWDWNIRSGEIYFSPRWKSMLGLADMEVDAHYDEWESRLHPDDQAQARRAVQEAISGDADVYQAEFRMGHTDGTYRWILARGRILRDARGRAHRMAGSHTDITDRKLAEAALRESKEHYRTLFEATFEAILVHRDGAILEVNDAFEALFGYTHAEAIGMPVLDTVAPESRTVVQEKIDQQTEGIYEAVARRKDGATFPVEAHAKTITYRGQPARISAMRDITERKRAEAALYESRELAESLNETATAIIGNLTFDAVLDSILQNVGRVVSHDAADIMLIEGHLARVVRSRGYGKWSGAETIDQMQLDLREMPELQKMVDAHQPILIPNTPESAAWIVVPESAWVRSYVSVPIIMDDVVIGMLNLNSSQVNAFTLEQIDSLQTFANQAAIAMQNARFFESERRASEQAQALLEANKTLSSTLSLNEVLQHILQQVARVLPYTTASILIYSDDQTEMAVIAGYDDDIEHILGDRVRIVLKDSPILKRIVETLEPTIIDDVRYHPDWRRLPGGDLIRSWLGIPLVNRDRLLGVLMLDHDKPGFYTPDHVDTARAFADQAAIALGNAHAYQAERRERAVADILRQTSEALATSLNLDHTFKLILRLLKRMVDFDGARVLLLEGSSVRVLAAEGLAENDDPLVGQAEPLSNYPQLEAIASSKKPTLFQEIPDNWRWSGDRSPRSWIGVPLATRGQNLGFLTVGSLEPAAYTPQDLNAISIFASQAAIAIENARLLMELENSLHELQQAQEQLARTSRVAAAGEIAMGVAHQVNNPLTTVIAETHLLLNRMQPGSSEYDLVMGIKQAAYQAGTVVQRLLDFARVRPYQFDVMDANQSIHSAVALIDAQLGPGISLVYDLQKDLPLIVGSQEHLLDVWINLLLNARDALADQNDGKIKIMTRTADPSQAVEVLITDNGPGIPYKSVVRIFDPFFTTKEHGTGLGLSVCHDIIEHHNGTIRVTSHEGIGTTFTIRLPVADAPADYDLLDEESMV